MDTKKLRQKILDLAIHGKLVPQDPNDEPASVLLERIRAEKEKLIKEGKIKAPMKSKSTGDTSHYPKDVPFEVPEGWALSTVIDVFQINPKNHEDDATEAGFVPMTNISDGFEDRFSFELKPWKSIKTGFTHFRNGDIAVAKISPCLENRKSFVVRGLPQEIGAGTTELFIFRSGQIIPEYGLLFFKSEFFISNCVGTFNGVVGQQRVARNTIEEMPFPIPPIGEQKRIIQRVGSIFRMVSEVENSQTALKDSIEKSKARILDMAIHGKLVPQDPSEEPAIALLKRINPGFQPSHNLHYEECLPSGWVYATLGEISDYGHCVSVSTDEIAETEWVLELEDIEKDTGRLLKKVIKSERAISGSRHVFYKGQVLYSKLRTYLNKVFVAEDCGFCTTEIIPITPKDGITAEYLNMYLRSPLFLAYTEQCGYGVKMPRLGTSDARKAIVPVPPTMEQHRIVTVTKQLFAQIDALADNL